VSTYSLAEAALLAAVRASGSGAVFTEQNSSRADLTVLDRAGVTSAAVLVQGGASEFADNLGQGRGTYGKRQQRHRIAIMLIQARGQVDDGTAATALHAAHDALVGYLDTVPRLNNAASVKRAEAVEADVPRLRRDNAWIYQVVMVEVLTETQPNLVEGPH
jgi:hypothetical protein